MFPVAWKTGTSYGNRDAWAIGVTPEYTVGVWVGNASGEGRPELTGINAAAPVMFDVFKLLKPQKWFSPPYDDMIQIAVCKYSGHRAGRACTAVDSVWIPLQGLNSLPCPYHQTVHLDSSKKFRVNTACENISNIVSEPWFILPPVQEYYYRQKNPFYRILPPLRSDCISSSESQRSMDIIYPPQQAKIFIPLELDGAEGEVIFKAAHRNQGAQLFWHINDVFITSTQNFHEISIRPPAGFHTLTVVDESGETIKRRFEVVNR